MRASYTQTRLYIDAYIIGTYNEILFKSIAKYLVLINTEIPKVTYYYVLILNLNLKRIINILKVILIS